MTQPTALYQLIETRLGETLADWVAERRRPDLRPPASWRRLAFELSTVTGVEVTNETLRVWFGADDPADADSPVTAGQGGDGPARLGATSPQTGTAVPRAHRAPSTGGAR